MVTWHGSQTRGWCVLVIGMTMVVVVMSVMMVMTQRKKTVWRGY